MSDRSERAYRRLPGPARMAVATGHGLRLRRWRYGPETDDLVAEARAREHWPRERWDDWLDDRRRRIAQRLPSVPHYRDAGRTTLTGGELLTKEAVRRDPRRLLADDADPRHLYEEHTSGTTGTPLTLWWSRATTRAWYALFEARARGWSGVTRRDAWAMIGGRLIVDQARDRPPFWVWNGGLRQLYLSAYHLRDDRAPAYAAAMERRSVNHLIGYPSALQALAEALIASGRRVEGIEVVIGNAEPVDDRQRAVVSEAFDAPLVETYGMAELAAAASECEAGSLHVWPEVGDIEVADGELVATGLLNDDMLLVRYRTGDRLAHGAAGEHGCPCGRTLPVIERIDGRADDVVVTPDGRRLGRLDPIFKADLPIRAAQVVQDRPGHLLIRIVPAAGYDTDREGQLIRRARDHVGPMEIDVVRVARLDRDGAGKVRGVVSELGERPG